MDTVGICFVAYGERARAQAGMAITAACQHTALPITVISDTPLGDARHVYFADRDIGARWAKLNLETLSPYRHTIYMDADTRIRGHIATIIKMLQDGFDMVIAPSRKQGNHCLHHLVYPREREVTFLELFNWQPLQLQGGVMGFNKNDVTRELFAFWRSEWMRWRDKDQGALLRAMDKLPRKPRIWLLSNEFNDGSLVQHFYGQARRRDNAR